MTGRGTQETGGHLCASLAVEHRAAVSDDCIIPSLTHAGGVREKHVYVYEAESEGAVSKEETLFPGGTLRV